MSPPTPPGPRLLPFLGVGREFDRDLPGFLRRCAQRWGGVVRLGTLGPATALLVSDPQLAEQVLQSRWRDFARDEVFRSAGRPVFGRGLLLEKGDPWLKLRRTMQPSFARSRLMRQASRVEQEIQARAARWERLAARGTTVSMHQEMARLTQDIAVQAVFDMNLGARLDAVLDAWAEVNTYLMHRLFSPLWRMLPPTWPVRANHRMRAAMQVIDSVVLPLIEQRRREHDRGDDRGDLLSLLLAARDPETDEGLSDAVLRDQVLVLFFAGFETTSSALTWAWILLARHAGVEQRLHDEIDEVLGGRPPTAEDLPKLRYTRQVLEETLRLYPSVIALAREPVGEQHIGDYPVREGSVVFISPYVLHHDPRWWTDPDRFDPDRFDPDVSHHRPRAAYCPFGAGPRVCIGRHFAMMEATLTLATMAQRVRPQLVAGEAYRPRPQLTFQVGGGAPMRLERR